MAEPLDTAAAGEQRLRVVNDILAKVQQTWLNSAELHYILSNFHKLGLPLQADPVSQPPSGSIWFYDKKKVRHFRHDDYNWKRKKGASRATDETHTRLKLHAVQAVACYHARLADNPNFHRRIYWLIDERKDEENNNQSIVMVHYLSEDPYPKLPSPDVAPDNRGGNRTTNAPLMGRVALQQPTGYPVSAGQGVHHALPGLVNPQSAMPVAMPVAVPPYSVASSSMAMPFQRIAPIATAPVRAVVPTVTAGPSATEYLESQQLTQMYSSPPVQVQAQAPLATAASVAAAAAAAPSDTVPVYPGTNEVNGTDAHFSIDSFLDSSLAAGGGNGGGDGTALDLASFNMSPQLVAQRAPGPAGVAVPLASNGAVSSASTGTSAGGSAAMDYTPSPLSTVMTTAAPAQTLEFAEPRIDVFNPEHGRRSGGERVLIVGRNFPGPPAKMQLVFGGQAVNTVWHREGVVSCFTPAFDSAGLVMVFIRTQDGRLTDCSQTFTVEDDRSGDASAATVFSEFDEEILRRLVHLRNVVETPVQMDPPQYSHSVDIEMGLLELAKNLGSGDGSVPGPTLARRVASELKVVDETTRKESLESLLMRAGYSRVLSALRDVARHEAGHVEATLQSLQLNEVPFLKHERSPSDDRGQIKHAHDPDAIDEQLVDNFHSKRNKHTYGPVHSQPMDEQERLASRSNSRSDTPVTYHPLASTGALPPTVAEAVGSWSSQETSTPTNTGSATSPSVSMADTDVTAFPSAVAVSHVAAAIDAAVSVNAARRIQRVWRKHRSSRSAAVSATPM